MRWILTATGCVALALVCSLFVPHAQVHAGTAQRFGLAELAQRADLAVEGRVLGAWARRGVGGRIETEYTLAVARTFVGEPCGLAIVRLPGGVLPDGTGLAIAGMPRLEVGEDVLLFLSAEGTRGTRMPVGLAQGKLRVAVQPDGSRRLFGDATGLDLVGPAGTAAPAAGGIDYVTALAEIDAGLAARAAGERR